MIETRVGYTEWEDHRFCGRSVMNDLCGGLSFSALNVLGITGRSLSREEAELFDELCAGGSAPDARAWPLKLIRIVSAYGGFYSGVAATQLCMEGVGAIGPWLTEASAEAILDYEACCAAAGGDLEAGFWKLLEKRKRLRGWGVPLRPRDERYLSMERSVTKRGRHLLTHWSAMSALSGLLRTHKQIEPNVSAAFGAALLDLGFSPTQIAPLGCVAINHMFVAHAAESSRERYPEYQRLAEDDVAYAGPPPRVLPPEWKRAST
ncbi:MAG: hypothetical protein IT381_22230 [Deltaproteobacteria bacterium]|nr:hypothetical protein [Deltaproteobacteria bacterium]